jgi:flagellar basal-body rod modification protein FlgD
MTEQGMDIQESLGTTIAPTNASAQSSDAMSALTGDDFFRLLIAQLSTQDPLEPMSNEDLMRQVSSIRDIELNTALTETLQSLVGQQHFAGASALIGKYVTGADAEDGIETSGVVVGARFEPGGQAVLILESGDELPMSQVATIEAADHLGEVLVGKYVTGVDRRDPANPLEVGGVITSVGTGEKGALLLELDNGSSLSLADVSSIGSPPEQESVVEKVLGAPAKMIQTVLGLR